MAALDATKLLAVPEGAEWLPVGLSASRSVANRVTLKGSSESPLGFASGLTLLPRALTITASSSSGSVLASRAAALLPYGGVASTAAAKKRAMDVVDATLSDVYDPEAVADDPFEAGLSGLECLNRLLRQGGSEWAEPSCKMPRGSVLNAHADSLERRTGNRDAGYGVIAVGKAVALISVAVEAAAVVPAARRARAGRGEASASAHASVVLHAAVAVASSLCAAIKSKVVNDMLYHLLDRWLGTFAVRYLAYLGSRQPFSRLDKQVDIAAASRRLKGACVSTVSLLAGSAQRHRTGLMLAHFAGGAKALAEQVESGTGVAGQKTSKPAAAAAAAAAAATTEEEEEEEFEVAGSVDTVAVMKWLVSCGYRPSEVTPPLEESQGNFHDDARRRVLKARQERAAAAAGTSGAAAGEDDDDDDEYDADEDQDETARAPPKWNKHKRGGGESAKIESGDVMEAEDLEDAEAEAEAGEQHVHHRGHRGDGNETMDGADGDSGHHYDEDDDASQDDGDDDEQEGDEEDEAEDELGDVDAATLEMLMAAAMAGDESAMGMLEEFQAAQYDRAARRARRSGHHGGDDGEEAPGQDDEDEDEDEEEYVEEQEHRGRVPMGFGGHGDLEMHPDEAHELEQMEALMQGLGDLPPDLAAALMSGDADQIPEELLAALMAGGMGMQPGMDDFHSHAD